MKVTAASGQAVSLIKTVFDSFMKMMDNAVPNRLELQDESVIKVDELDGTKDVPGKRYIYKALSSKRLVTVDVFLISGDRSNVHIFIKCPGLPSAEIEKIDRKKVVEALRKYCIEYNLLDDSDTDDELPDDEKQGETFEPKDAPEAENSDDAPDVENDMSYSEGEVVDEAKKINVKLRKINASSEIDLVAINCNYSINEALDDISLLANDLDFISSLTEEPVAFEIIPEAADISVQETSDFDPTVSAYSEMYTESLALYNNIKAIHWGSKGETFFTLHEKAEEIANAIHYRLDLIAEWEVQHNKKIINANKLNTIEYLIETDYGFNLVDGFNAIKILLDKDIEALEAFYTNLPHDEQSVVDEWLVYDNKMSNYLLTRIQEV